MKQKPIYVEIPIKTNIELLWDATQNPQMHEQWDLRFSTITYNPTIEDEPQTFTYTRNITPLYRIEGWGKSVGTLHKEDGNRSSALHFGTAQRLSPIREGRGYWKYEPQKDDIKFYTQYDYDVNFGRIGKAVDRNLFRPAIGWATALSFDVLKRWLEKGETPHSQYIRFFSTYLMTILFAFVWMYQGLIPKVIGMHTTEREMVGRLFNFNEGQLTTVVFIIGIAELLFGLVWLFYRNKSNLFLFQLIVFPLLTIAAIIAVPEVAVHPFNPVTFNSSLIVLSIIGYLLSKDLPTAKSCKRQR